MRTRPAAASVVAFGIFALSALGARPAWADTSCTTDADCVKGWACQVTGGSGCAYACPAGQTCSPPPDCVTTETKSCVPGPCKADSDCAAGMVCYTSTTTSDCPPVPSCPPGAACATPACTPTTQTQSQCIPKYDAPCTADADCGAGFSCIADSSGCGCASAGSAPSADGGATPPPVTTCDCPAATTSSCHALPVSCKTAADCASGWTCEDVPSDVTCASAGPATPPPSGANGSSGGSGATPAQDAGVDPCPPPAPAMKMCLPPYYSLGGGSLGVSESSGVPRSTSGGGTTTSTSGSAGSSSTPATPGAGNNASDSGQTSTAAGCSVALGSKGGTGAGGLALLALGLFGFARRRRSERTAR